MIDDEESTLGGIFMILLMLVALALLMVGIIMAPEKKPPVAKYDVETYYDEDWDIHYLILYDEDNNPIRVDIYEPEVEER